MKKVKQFYGSVKNKAAVAGGLLLTTGVAFAQEAPTTPEAAISSAQTTILALIAVGGAAGIAIKLASVGWEVGAKLLGRLRGKA